MYPMLAGNGIAVCAADVRGMGDLQPEFSPGARGYQLEHSGEESYAWASLILGRSLLGQRVTDLIALVRCLAGDYPQARIVIAARGELTIPALCAMALEPAISSAYLGGHLVSWRNLLESESYSHPFANFVPDVIKYTDLPQIAASIAPRRVTFAGAVNSEGFPVDVDRVRLLYASPNAEVLKEDAWNVDTLSRATSRS